jgi:hypothetical protein
MKSLAALKTLPYIGLSLYAMFKAKPGKKGGPQKPAETMGRDASLTGDIKKALKDSWGFFVHVQVGKDAFWLASESELPAVGQRIRFTPGKIFDAYESKDLGMAFERLYLVKNLEVVVKGSEQT